MGSRGWMPLVAVAAIVTVLAIAQSATGGGVRAAGGGHVCDRDDPSSCAYESDITSGVGVLEDLPDLEDPSRGGYVIPIVVRYPTDVEGPRPLIIWHHGGDPGESCSSGTAEWGNLLAGAGYVVINPCRTFPDLTDELRDECNASGFDDEDADLDSLTDSSCQYWLAQYRYGGITTKFLLRNLDVIEAAHPALDGMFDGERIAVAGFSAGTTGVHVNAGAWQQWTPDGPLYDQDRASQPIAFFAAGPQGPQYAGFGSGFQSKDGEAGWTEHSWTGIERPFMFVTGVGDETDEPPESRVAGFLTSVGNTTKYMLWNTSPEAVHGTMNLKQCDPGVQEDHCDWIGSAGLAYFDAVLRHRRQAERWLASDALKILSGKAIELYRR